jgi:uncharacterized protein involved in response to NO
MHKIVRYYIRASFVFLVAGSLLGIWMLYQKAIGGQYPDPEHVTAHTHLILVGSVMGMILGVAQWMFPRPQPGSRYSPDLAMAIFYLFVAATVARTLAEFALPFLPLSWLRVVAFVAGSAQIVAFALYAFNMWPRIRAVGSQFREARGEKF